MIYQSNLLPSDLILNILLIESALKSALRFRSATIPRPQHFKSITKSDSRPNTLPRQSGPELVAFDDHFPSELFLILEKVV